MILILKINNSLYQCQFSDDMDLYISYVEIKFKKLYSYLQEITLKQTLFKSLLIANLKNFFKYKKKLISRI